MDTPIENRLTKQLRTFATLQYFIAGALMAALAGFYLLVYRPQTAALAELDAQINQNRAELKSDRTKTDRLPRVASELQQLKARLSNFKKLPPEPQLGQFVDAINKISRSTGLPEPTVVPGEAVIAKYFSQQPIQLSFRGDLLKVYDFISQVEGMERLTRVDDLTIKTVDGEPGVVDADLTVDIYYAED